MTFPETPLVFSDLDSLRCCSGVLQTVRQFGFVDSFFMITLGSGCLGGGPQTQEALLLSRHIASWVHKGRGPLRLTLTLLSWLSRVCKVSVCKSASLSVSTLFPLEGESLRTAHI